MGDERTAWHYGFGELVEEEVGTAMEVMRELKLVNEQRTDIILLRKEAHSSEPIVGSLGRLWAVLPKMSVIEYKSRGDPPNVGVLDQLFGYGHLAARRFRDNLDEAEDLALVLAVGTVTPRSKGKSDVSPPFASKSTVAAFVGFTERSIRAGSCSSTKSPTMWVVRS